MMGPFQINIKTRKKKNTKQQIHEFHMRMIIKKKTNKYENMINEGNMSE